MTKREKKSKINWLKVQLTLLIITGIIAVLALLFLFLFRIKDVVVEGNIHYTDEESR